MLDTATLPFRLPAQLINWANGGGMPEPLQMAGGLWDRTTYRYNTMLENESSYTDMLLVVGGLGVADVMGVSAFGEAVTGQSAAQDGLSEQERKNAWVQGTVAMGANAFAAFGPKGIAPGGRSGGPVIPESYMTRFGPTRQGPLPSKIANNFRGGSYTERTLTTPETYYRVFGGKANEIGAWWTSKPPKGPLQAQMDLALRPEWGNSATNVTQIRVPAGTKVYEGCAAPQGGIAHGGGQQTFIPAVDPKWVVKPNG